MAARKCVGFADPEILQKAKATLTKAEDPLKGFPLLKFVGFTLEFLRHLYTTVNQCRGTQQEDGNVSAIQASFLAWGWNLFEWPFPFVVYNDIRNLIDRRHSKKAAELIGISKVLGAQYKFVDDHEWGWLTPDSKLTMAGVYMNATDGSCNAVVKHFIHATMFVCKDNGLDNTDMKIVKALIELMGIDQRYPPNGRGKSQVINACLNWDEDGVSMTDKNTEGEVAEYLETTDKFANNAVDKEGTLRLVMTAEKAWNKRYAWDLLRHLLEAERDNYNVRILVKSKGKSAKEVREDRLDLFTKCVQYYALATNSYKDTAAKVINNRFESIGMTGIDFPQKGVDALPGEVYVLHQITGGSDGETEPEQIDFSDYEFDPMS